MGKVILKTALKVVAAVLGALVLAFGVMSLAFPRTMAQIFEKFGSYSVAAGYSSLSYTYYGEVGDLGRCFEDSVFAYNDGDTVSYGEKLIKHEKFNELCEERKSSGIDYKQFVYGNISAAKYRKGDLDGAIAAALAGDAENVNAFGTLTIAVVKANDKQAASRILQELPAEPSNPENAKYYNAIKNELTKLTQDGGEQ